MGGVRGATWHSEFELPFGEEYISVLEITYSQNGEIILQKRKEDCTIKGNIIYVELTQEETFLFDEKQLVDVQIKAKDPTGNAVSSDVISEFVYPSLSQKPL